MRWELPFPTIIPRLSKFIKSNILSGGERTSVPRSLKYGLF